MSARPSLTWRSAAQKRRLARGLELVEERLTTVASEYPGDLGDACRATLSAGGKRVRPLLTLLCARRGEAAGEPVLRAAAAVELLHMATLVHDDVLDRAELRRGRPTVAHQYGAATAVSAGNYLLARAFSELVGAGVPAAVDLLSATAVGLSEGEVLQRAEAYDVGIGVDAYVRRCERKTADLFSAACALGALLSGAGDRCGRRRRRVRSSHRHRLPGLRRHPRLQRGRGRHGQATRHRRPRRHGHAAADLRPRGPA